MPPPFHYSIMNKTIEDEAVDGMCMLSWLPGQSQLSPTNAAASRKDAKKEANRIAALSSRHKKHWEKEINKLNGKKRFTPELVRWCINPATLVEKMNKQIQWEDVVQLSRSGMVKSYGNSPKPMEQLSLFDLPIHLTNALPSKPPVFNTSTHHRKHRSVPFRCRVFLSCKWEAQSLETTESIIYW